MSPGMGVGWARPRASGGWVPVAAKLLFTGNPPAQMSLHPTGGKRAGRGTACPSLPGVAHTSPDSLCSTAMESALYSEGTGPGRAWRSWKPWRVGRCPEMVSKHFKACVSRGENRTLNSRGEAVGQEPVGTGSLVGAGPPPPCSCVYVPGGEREYSRAVM